MFSDSTKYLFSQFREKEKYLLIKSEETYDAVTGTIVVIESESPIILVKIPLKSDNLPVGCLSTDSKFLVLTEEIDTTDKFKDSSGKIYIIKHIEKISFSPSSYEVIVRVN